MRNFLIYTFLLISTLAYSIPAKRLTKTITVDGKSIEVTLVGNEKVHFWRSADGRKFQQKEDGEYAIFPEEAYKVALESKKFQLRSQENANPNSASFAKARAKRKAAYSGEKRGLVILVNFSDNNFTWTTNPKRDYQLIASGVNYKGSLNYGSVRDYFKTQSYGKFDYVLDVAGPVTLSHAISYYGKNDIYGDDMRAGTMVWEACQALDDDIDFSQYDWDGDGVVEQIFVIYAGYGEAQGGRSTTIWPHSSSLAYAKQYESEIGSCVFDGVTVDTYACSCELSGSYGKTPDGVGTICHEFSHCFGLPDFYCTDYGHEALTMNTWSLMDYGSYAGDGFAPVSYTAYERWFCGWLEPTELSSPQFVKDMGDINETGDAYIIYNEGNKNEYYIMQNVQQTGWNISAPGHGMLVLHVDYDKNAWFNNTPNNNENHLRMTPICADNTRNNNSLSGDTYPGTARRTELTDDSRPAAELYNANTDGKKLMHKPITDIAESEDGLISFTFMGGITLLPPTELSAKITGTDITASWLDDQEHTTSYNIKYGAYDKDRTSEGVLIDEDFSKAKATTDSNSDISDKLDEYLNTAGFTGSSLYRGVGGLKVGTSTKQGEIISPVMSSAADKISITISTQKYRTYDGSVTIQVFEEGELLPFFTSNPIEAGTTETIEIDNMPERYKIVIFATKRCYLSALQISGTVPEPYFNETCVEGVAEMPYTFTPAFEADKYWMQIQAAGADDLLSEWSDIIFVDKGVTRISSATTATLRNILYNVNGQRVDGRYKGIVIKNGKKFRL